MSFLWDSNDGSGRIDNDHMDWNDNDDDEDVTDDARWEAGRGVDGDAEGDDGDDSENDEYDDEDEDNAVVEELSGGRGGVDRISLATARLGMADGGGWRYPVGATTVDDR